MILIFFLKLRYQTKFYYRSLETQGKFISFMLVSLIWVEIGLKMQDKLWKNTHK